MNTIIWVCIGIITIALVLYIIGAIKNIPLMQSIPEVFLLPAAAAIVISLLNDYLPDASHIFRISIMAIVTIAISQIFAIFDKIKLCRQASLILILINTIIWINLYGTTFYIYYVYRTTMIIAALIYAVIFGIVILHLKPFSKEILLKFAVFYFPAAFLNFCGFITMIHSRRSYSYFLFIGSIFLMLFIIFETFKVANVLKFNERIQKIVRTILLTAAQTLITASGLLMIR